MTDATIPTLRNEFWTLAMVAFGLAVALLI